MLGEKSMNKTKKFMSNNGFEIFKNLEQHNF